MIRFIVKTVSSRTDVNGNRYHFCIITTTQDRQRSLIVKDIGESNGKGMLRSAGLDWEEIYSVEYTLPIREFNRRKKMHENGESAYWEHEVTAEMILDLERLPTHAEMVEADKD